MLAVTIYKGLTFSNATHHMNESLLGWVEDLGIGTRLVVLRSRSHTVLRTENFI